MEHKHYEKAVKVHAVLAVAHTQLLDLQKPVPFKIGIHKDMIAAHRGEVSAFGVRCMFEWLTARSAYFSACSAGAARYGLDGPCGAVTEKDAARARALLTDKAEREARRAAWQAENVSVKHCGGQQ